ncbi:MULTISPECIES: hypothetical protein [Streptomyces]|uniref:hypothetical protein n=1 Tax=Streptomyces TaxID=1883 RepID=UPI001A94F91F|nr:MULTISPECIES: hypothetical protein [Streptomyces]MBO0912763.1 hypothetical protein [Streptomyces laculatispora]MDF6066102.1 hypothetical protein [Streptomyces sp. JH010]WSS87959.1 hypothetical protein OG199_35420 [Streptomyces sp. NBC_01176]
MTRDNDPARVQPPNLAPVPQQPAIGAGLPAAIAQGAAQGAARAITARLVDKFLTNPPDWLRTLWHALPRPWE